MYFSAELVKQMGGHSLAMETFGVYGHVIDGEMEKFAKLVDRILSDVLNDV